MVGDSMVSRGAEKSYGAQKVFRTRKFLVGMSGVMANFVPFFEWLCEHESMLEDGEDATALYRWWDAAPKYDDGYSYILADRVGRVYCEENGPPVWTARGYDAIGSGHKFALGAMAMGASAKEAVRVAASLDSYTGGPLHYVRF
jgi:ATP-dependent protease HslVU (ClpYQ) peptidase subunit